MELLAATAIAAIRLSAASDDGLSDDLCAPTKTTGTWHPKRAKASAAEVYPSVSVPWVTTTPLKPWSISCTIRLEMAVQCLGVTFSLKMLERTSAVMFAVPASSGMDAYRSPAVR